MNPLRAALIPVVLFTFACGGSTDNDSGTGGSSTGGASTGGATSGGSGGSGGTGATQSGGSGGGSGGVGGCTTFVPCCDASGNTVEHHCENGMPVCPPGASFPPSGICGGTSSSCTPNQPCKGDEFCDYGDNKCGAGQPGSCKKRPQGCDLLYAPVCACDGKVAGNECSANAGGVDIADTGGCAAPQGTFACGSVFCQTDMQYCQRAVSDVGGYPDSFTCMQLPTPCNKAPGCACLASVSCGGSCTEAGPGELTVTCPGG